MLLRVATFAFLALTGGAWGEEIPLWPQDHAANQGAGPAVTEPRPSRLVVHHSPSLELYLPEKFNTEAVVLICPGGGYSVVAIDHEGDEVGQWLKSRGVNAAVLKYRCGGGANGHPAPLGDALRAMRLLRSLADKWNWKTDKVGVMGFSAGGHLAACVSTMSDEGDSKSDDPIERLSSKPNFSILVYPVISMQRGLTHGGSRKNLLGESPSAELVEQMSCERRVTAETPPTFLAHASDDRVVVPANSLRYFEALLARGVPAELHMYQRGGHGFGMKTLQSKQNPWLDDLNQWLGDHVVPETPVGESPF